MTLAVSIVCIITSVLLVVEVLAHRGTGGGLSDMLGGGGSQLGSSVAANRNLTRLTYLTAFVWLTCIATIGLLTK